MENRLIVLYHQAVDALRGDSNGGTQKGRLSTGRMWWFKLVGWKDRQIRPSLSREAMRIPLAGIN